MMYRDSGGLRMLKDSNPSSGTTSRTLSLAGGLLCEMSAYNLKYLIFHSYI